MDTWDRRTWNHLPAVEVVLSLTLGSGETVAGRTTFRGRDAAKAALREFCGDLEENVSFWFEVAAEYQVDLMGDLRVLGKSAQKPKEIPFVAYLHLDKDGEVDPMTLAKVEMRPLVDAWKKVAEAGR